MALDENKVDLARFLSDKPLAGAPVDKIVIVGGGFEEEDAIKCSSPNIDIRSLKRFHEEADTRMVLHCVDQIQNSLSSRAKTRMFSYF